MMKTLATGSLPPSGVAYLKSRLVELTLPDRKAAVEPLADWAVNRIRLDQRPFSFEGHEYLQGIYDDQAPRIVLIKATQIGGTTYAILRSLHACAMGLHVIYFFPTAADVTEFSKSRVGPFLTDNAFLQGLIGDTDTANLKQIGNASLHFRGMQRSTQMKSIPADMLVYDELDEASPDARALAMERLSHSVYKRVIELSNPSIPNYGIDASFQDTDQRHWTLRCEACGTWTALDKEFPVRLGQEMKVLLARPDGSWYRACRHCQGELDIAKGEWVADFPGRESHGYLISQLNSSRVEPAEIAHQYLVTAHPERFYNLKIGIAWIDVDNRLTTQAVLERCGNAGIEMSSSDRTTMGVDTGKVLHVVIGRRRPGDGKRQIIYLGVHEEFAELDDLMRRFKVGRCVIDGQPETHITREFAKRHRGRVFMCYFNARQKEEAKWDKEKLTVQTNRTDVLDASRLAVRRGEVILPRQSQIVREFATHIANDVKRLVENEETGAQEFRYIRTGVDHFSLAFTYENIAAERHGVIAATYFPGYSAGRKRISVATGLPRHRPSRNR
jgi:hypothetical protein